MGWSGASPAALVEWLHRHTGVRFTSVWALAVLVCEAVSVAALLESGSVGSVHLHSGLKGGGRGDARTQTQARDARIAALRQLDATSLAAFGDRELASLGLSTGPAAPAYWYAPCLWARYEADAVGGGRRGGSGRARRNGK